MLASLAVTTAGHAPNCLAPSLRPSIRFASIGQWAAVRPLCTGASESSGGRVRARRAKGLARPGGSCHCRPFRRARERRALGSPTATADKLRLAAIASIVVAVLVLALKYLAYWITGSVALYSDALESIVNLITALVALYA